MRAKTMAGRGRPGGGGGRAAVKGACARVRVVWGLDESTRSEKGGGGAWVQKRRGGNKEGRS